MIQLPASGRVALSVCALLILGCGPTSGDDDVGERPSSAEGRGNGFAVVELFTSQGCSSCPPADRNLASISQAAAERGLPVYTLSFHVDYWNGLGWKDPFSSDAISHPATPS